MKKFIKWIKSPASDFALFIILLILANFAAHKAFLRFDLTGPKSYSLSKASKSVVKTIEEPLNVRVFFSENLTPPYNGVAQYVKDILVEYKGAGNRNFSVTYMDLSKPENEKLAREYGLQQLQIQEVKNNEVGVKKAFMGIVISYGDNIELLDGITTASGFEYAFTTKISKMISTADTLASFASGDKITLTLYSSSLLKNYRLGTEQAEEILRASINSLNKKNLDRLDFKVVNPAASEIEELTAKYGLPRLNVQSARGKAEPAVFGAVLEHGEKFVVLPVQIQRSLFGNVIAGLEEAEENIAASIEIILSKTTKIGYVTGHEEVSLEAAQNPYGQQDVNNAANFKAIISDLYELQELKLAEENIPAGMASIIVNGPKTDFTEEELYKIDQFIMKGGNVLFFVDGVVPGQTDYYGNQSFMPNQINLDRLLEKYGVKRGNNIVLDKHCYSQMDRQYGKVNLYWVPVLQKGSLEKKNPVTNNLGYVYMFMNGTLDVSEAQGNKNIKTTALVKSSPESWTMDKNIMLNPLMMNPPADAKAMKAETLGVLLEGKFSSAFDKAPEGSVAAENNGNANAGSASVAAASIDGTFEADSHLASGVQNGRIIVMSSSIITTGQLVDTNVTGNPTAMLLLNEVDYLNGNEDLCTMRSKGLSVNVLNVKSQAFANIMKWFNQFGLVAIVAFAGFIVWRKRCIRRRQIDEKYNPDDDRRIR